LDSPSSRKERGRNPLGIPTMKIKIKKFIKTFCLFNLYSLEKERIFSEMEEADKLTLFLIYMFMKKNRSEKLTKFPFN
jgi:hypothetical protein